jgi:phage/conjugal plasmid C-4 type zinc finger TraR family protein
VSYGSVDGLEGLAQIAHVEDSLAIQRLRRTVNDNATGECQECGEPIPPARLAAVPGARYCVGCQGERDGKPSVRLTFNNPYVP